MSTQTRIVVKATTGEKVQLTLKKKDSTIMTWRTAKETARILALPMAERILALRTRRGGWTRADLDSLGVPWPPTKGWRQQLIEIEDAGL